MDKKNKIVKENIIEKTAYDLEIEKDVVDKVISWSYHRANEATRTNREVELSGFGTFTISDAKLRRKIKRTEDYLSMMKERFSKDGYVPSEEDLKNVETY